MRILFGTTIMLQKGKHAKKTTAMDLNNNPWLYLKKNHV